MGLAVVESVVNAKERDEGEGAGSSCVEAVISNREGQRENAVWPCLD